MLFNLSYNKLVYVLSVCKRVTNCIEFVNRVWDYRKTPHAHLHLIK